MNFNDLKKFLESGGSRSLHAEQANEPFAAYGAPVTGEEPFPEYEEEVYCVDEDKEVDTYGGETKVRQTVDQTKCESCGAATRYDPTESALVCDYCGHRKRIVASAAAERKLKLGKDNSRKWHEETRVFRCGNCGATSVFSQSEFASVCPFCGSPSIVRIEDIEGVRPNAVIPFRLDAEKARGSYARWIASKAYAPRIFKKNRKKRSMRGVYMPCWTFDSATRSSYKAVVGDYYYVTVGVGKNAHRERRVAYRTVYGTYPRMFDDILIPSGKELEADEFRRIGPYPTKEAVEYHSSFLAGYSAEHYTTTLEQGWQSAQTEMRAQIDEGIRGELRPGCDVIDRVEFVTDYASNKFKYLMIPVYVCNHEFRGKNYVSFVNGVSGRVVGNYPKSKGKIAATVFGILGALVAIGLAIYFGIFA